jgi:hypothetical protein
MLCRSEVQGRNSFFITFLRAVFGFRSHGKSAISRISPPLSALFLGGLMLSGPTLQASSPFTGSYVGPVYFSTQGEFSLPEQIVGQVLITVDSDGNLSDLSGDLTGTVNDTGTILFTQPNPFSLTTGTITGTALAATGSAQQGQVTVTTRIVANSGAGTPSTSLADRISQVNPADSLVRMERVRHVNNQFVAVGDRGAVAFSDDGLKWNRFGMNTRERLNNVAHGNGVWLVVGDDYNRFRSTDGISWAPLPKPLLAFDIHGLAFGNGVFVQVDINGTVSRSADGSAWTEVGTPLTAAGFPNVDFVNGRFVLWRNAQISFSDDGSTWSAPILHGAGVASGSGTSPQLVTFGNGRYVVGGALNLSWSTDGISWTPAATAVQGIRMATFDGEAFLAIDADKRVWRSNNGSVWTPLQTFNSISSQGSMAFGPDRAVCVGSFLYTSTDGSVWELPENDVTRPDIRNVNVGASSGGIALPVYQTGFSAGRFFVNANVGTIGPDGVQGANALIRTGGGEGDLWLGDAGYIYRQAGMTASRGPVLTDRNLRTAVRGSIGGIVIAGDDGVMIRFFFTVENGVGEYRYELLPPLTGADLHWGAFSTGNPGPRILVGEGGTILYTVDSQLRDWSTVNSGTTRTLRHVDHYTLAGQSFFVATGQGGTLLTSTNGLQWIARETGTSVSLVGSAVGGPGIIVAGEDGTLLGSANGVAWERLRRLPTSQRLTLLRSSPVQAVGERGVVIKPSTVGTGLFTVEHLGSMLGQIRAAALGNGRFVLVGSAGSASSPDGRIWQARSTAQSFEGIAHGAGRFVGVGAIGTIATSDNGLDWTPVTPAPVAQRLHAVTYGSGRFAAVGEGGTVLVSVDGREWVSKGPGGSLDLRSVTHDAGRFVATGLNATVRSLDAGETWTGAGLLGNNHRAVAAGNGRFVSVADAGWIAISTDGTSWTRHQLAAPSPLESRPDFTAVAFADGNFWAVTEGAIHRSTNGAANTWERLGSGIPTALPVAFPGNGQLLLAGGNQIHLMPLLASSAPIVTGQPLDQVLDDGDNLVLNAAAVGPGPLTYQWFKDGRLLVDGDGVSGATTPSLTVTGVTVRDAGLYQFAASSPNGSRSSREALIRVEGGPRFNLEPMDQSVAVGGSVMFTAEATGDDAISWQWRFNGIPIIERAGISGVRSPTLTLTGIATIQAGLYDVVASTTGGSRESRAASLVVRTPPVVIADPVGAVASAGGSVQFNVVVEGSNPLTYVWRRGDGIIDGSDPRYSGLNSARLSLGGLTAADSGAVFSVTVTNDLGSATSRSATLYVVAPGTFRPDFGFASDTSSGSSTVRVSKILPTSDGRFVGFGSVRAGRLNGGYLADLMFRFDASGALDTSFSPLPFAGAGRAITTAVPAHNGGFIVVGSFTLNTPNPPGANITLGGVVRFNPNLSPDPAFVPPTSFTTGPRALGLLSGGRYVVGRSGSGAGAANELLFLNTAGEQQSLIINTASTNRGELFSLAIQPNDTIWYSVNSGLRQRLADGTDVRLFQSTAADPSPRAVITGPTGEIYYNRGNQLVRVLPNGTLDNSFAVTVSLVRDIAFMPDGSLVLGGDFATVNGNPMRAIAHVQANGQSIPGFTSPYDGAQDNVYLPVVHSLVPLNDGSVLAGSNIRLAAGKSAQRQDYIQRVQIYLPGDGPNPNPAFSDWIKGFNLPPGQDGPDDDADGDGIPNRLEYALGGNPGVPNSAQWPVGRDAVVDGVTYPGVQFTRNRLAVGVDIGVRASAALDFNPPLDTMESVEDLGNGVERVTVRGTVPLPGVITFFFEIRFTTPD